MMRVACAALGNGYHVPSLKELLTIVDTTREGPCVDPVFSGTPTGLYRTTTRTPGGSAGDYYQVSLGGGSVSFGVDTGAAWVRCVR